MFFEKNRYLKENWHGFWTYLEKLIVYWNYAKKTIGENDSFVNISQK